MVKLINFDKQFEAYLATYIAMNKDKYADFAEFEDKIYEIYEGWQNQSCIEIGGITPKEYVDNLAQEGKLFAHIIELIEADIEVSDIVTFKAIEQPDAEEFFIKLLAGEEKDLQLYGALALKEIGGTNAIREFANLVIDEDTAPKMQAIAYEYLTDDKPQVIEILMPSLYTVSEETQKFIVEILATYKGNDDIFMWLVTMLYRGDDVILFANLLSNYSNPKGIEMMNAFLIDAEVTYLEYIELRSAIEMLGGECSVKKNFDNDEYYQTIIQGEAND